MHIMQIIGKNHKGKNDNSPNGKQVVQCGTAWFLKNKSTVSNLSDLSGKRFEEVGTMVRKKWMKLNLEKCCIMHVARII